MVVICDLCHGDGEVRFYHNPPDPQTVDPETCHRCLGEGVVEVVDPYEAWLEHQMELEHDRKHGLL